MQSFNKLNFNYLLELHWKSFKFFTKLDYHLLCVLFYLEMLGFISSPIHTCPRPYINSCFCIEPVSSMVLISGHENNLTYNLGKALSLLIDEKYLQMLLGYLLASELLLWFFIELQCEFESIVSKYSTWTPVNSHPEFLGTIQGRFHIQFLLLRSLVKSNLFYP